MSAAPVLEATPSANVAELLTSFAAERPDQCAVIDARTGATLTFGALDVWSERLARGLTARGIGRGTRALVLVKPGLEFVAIAFALFRVGAVPVFVDPGLGRRHLLRCIEQAACEVLVAMRPVLALRAFVRRPFRSVKTTISTGRWPGAVSLEELACAGAPLAPVHASDDNAAVVAFTSGATGVPKGVVLTHGALRAKAAVLRDLFGVDRRSVQLAVLPLIALLGPGLGCTTVLPDLDASRPARARPAKLVDAIERHGVTHAFGSPTIWSRVARYCSARGALLTSLRALVTGGAPVPPALVAALRPLMPAGETWTPLGATESIVVTSVAGAELLATAEVGRGTLVGRPVPGVELRLVRIDDGALGRDEPALEVPDGMPGEIAVRGALVTRSYDDALANRLSRIPARGGDWHRMGDLGRRDAEGRIWFCGRKAERVETASGLLLTTCIEQLFAHPAVRRVALVGVGARPRQRAFLVVEPEHLHTLLWPPARHRLARELLERARVHPEAHVLEGVLFRRRLPVDVRHAAKILRGELAAWAARKVR